MKIDVKLPDGLRLVPTALTAQQLKAVVPFHYFFDSVAQSRQSDYAKAVSTAPEVALQVDVKMADGTPVDQLLLKLADWIERIPHVTDGAIQQLWAIEKALNLEGYDRPSVRRSRRILSEQLMSGGVQ